MYNVIIIPCSHFLFVWVAWISWDWTNQTPPLSGVVGFVFFSSIIDGFLLLLFVL